MAIIQNVSGIEIRPAIAADVPAILGFIRALAEYEKLSDAVVAREEMLREQLFGARPAAEVLIANLDGLPVGFALFFPSFSTFLAKPGIYLEDVFVEPKFRGHGVGKALLAHLAKLTLERGGARFEWSVLNWNEPSIQFYKGLGGEPLDEWTSYRLTGERLKKLAETL